MVKRELKLKIFFNALIKFNIDNSSEIRFLESLGDVPIIRKKRPRRKKLTKLDEKLLG